MATVYICQASCDERGKAYGGSAGDQTGREVYKRSWYAGNWNILLRPRSKVVARKMVAFAEAVCASNFVGYDQWQRNTLRDVARAAGWDASKIKTKCETDCSAFVSCCAEAAGVNMDRAYTSLGSGQWNAPVTQNMCSKFCETGAFVALTDKYYLTGTDYLEAGDVLVRESGHTCLVVSDGPRAINPTFADEAVLEKSAKAFATAKLYEVITKTDPLNVRHEPGSAGAIIGTFARSEVVTGDAEATLTDGTVWIRCTNGALTGWCSAAYLKEVTEKAKEKTEAVDDMVSNEANIAHMSAEQAAAVFERAMSKPATAKAVIAAFIDHLEPAQAAVILDKAQEYYGKLSESEWIKATGELEEAFSLDITDSSRPRGLVTREEAAAMALRAYKLGKKA